jgi:hypothetical protein
MAYAVQNPLIDYFEQFKNGDSTLPSNEVQLELSRKMDAVMQVQVERMYTVLRTSYDHFQRIGTLVAQPRTSGSIRQNKILFQGISAFEQMVVLSDWLARANIREVHTFFFAWKDDYIHIRANVPKNSPPSTMHIVLGATSGDRKMPKYSDWAINDPWQNANHKRFIYALEGLEIVRQPNFSAATMIKGNAFEVEYIDPAWRYGTTYACVEDTGQSRISPKKQRSAALSACSLVEEFSNASDPTALETNFCLPVEYENYNDDHYIDHLNLDVSPGNLIAATKKAVIDRQDEELSRLMQNLLIAKIGVPQTPVLRAHIAEILATNSVE